MRGLSREYWRLSDAGALMAPYEESFRATSPRSVFVKVLLRKTQSIRVKTSLKWLIAALGLFTSLLCCLLGDFDFLAVFQVRSLLTF